MKEQTKQIIRAALDADETATPEDKAATAALLNGGAEGGARVTRAEAAAILRTSVKTVDRLHAQGKLTAIRFPDRVRGRGFAKAEVERLATGRAA